MATSPHPKIPSSRNSMRDKVNLARHIVAPPRSASSTPVSSLLVPREIHQYRGRTYFGMGAILAGLTVVSVCVRLLPHPANFTPIAALALFSGVYAPKRWNWTFPICAMLVSDLIIGFYDMRIMAAVYGSLLLPILISHYIRKNPKFISITAGSMCGSLLFFLITNFAVWAYSPLYPRTADGLAEAYIAGVPFFRNTVFGDLFWVSVFFGGYAFVLKLSRHAKTPLSVSVTTEHPNNKMKMRAGADIFS